MQLLFDGDENRSPPASLSKRGFGEAIGVSPGRVSQLIEMGLPMLPNGRIHVEDGRRWYADNVDPNRRRGDTKSASHGSSRSELDRIKVERERLKLETERGALIDRAAAERILFSRARGERDRWIAWTSRAAPEIASAAGGETAAVFAVLDRLVRDHLRTLAETPYDNFT